MKALFVAHDCCMAGAQHSFLRILRWVRAHTDWRIGVIALKGGPLSADYAQLAPLALWQDVFRGDKSPSHALDTIAQLTNGKPDIIFGNTVVSASAFDLLAKFDAPIVTRIAELDNSIDRYATPAMLQALLRHTSGYIAVSSAVSMMLRSRFAVPAEKITVINGAIEQTATSLNVAGRAALLARWGCTPQTPLLWGCGSISSRKGADLFLQTAETLLAAGYADFKAFWAGHPEDDLVRSLFLQKEHSPAREHVVFLGQVESPARLMAPGDIFLLTSREDPFPLVCLEAAERGLPTVCFPETGGSTDFAAAGGGVVAQSLSAQAMGACVLPWLADRDACRRAGALARQTVLQRHTMAQAGPQFTALFERLASLNNQEAAKPAAARLARQARATRPLADLLADVTAVVRTVGERTTEACLHLLGQALPEANIHVISEVPFSRAVRRSFEIGIEQRRKWTFVLDADVLLRAAFLGEVLAFAERQQANTFVVQGLVYDKFFSLLRPAGNHLYRTKHLALASAMIPEEGSTLRPEAGTIDRMVERGYLFIQKQFVAGLHDYEQHYFDIAKKCFVQAHKHGQFVRQVWPLWQAKASEDPDFRAAMIGAQAGQQHQGTVFIDNAFLAQRFASGQYGNALESKPSLAANAFDDASVVQTLTAAIQTPDCEYMQGVMFPPHRWDHVYGNGVER